MGKSQGVESGRHAREGRQIRMICVRFPTKKPATYLRRDSKTITCLSFIGNCESLACKPQILRFSQNDKQISVPP